MQHEMQAMRLHHLRRSRWRGILGAVLLLVLPTQADAIQLVTSDEAALPPDRLPPTLEVRGSPTRRPSITVVSPAPNAGAVSSPVLLKLKLQAFGGAKIDTDSVVVTYRKTPLIDLTQRLRPYITADGIEVPDAEIPAGSHQFRIELRDKDGRAGGADFSFEVRK
jgi:hypothetical protein